MNRTVDQVADLVLKVMQAAAEPMHQDEIEAVVNWIQEAETDRSILYLFEQGKVFLRWKDGDLLVGRRS